MELTQRYHHLVRLRKSAVNCGLPHHYTKRGVTRKSLPQVLDLLA
jgi:hypothetical protein